MKQFLSRNLVLTGYRAGAGLWLGDLSTVFAFSPTSPWTPPGSSTDGPGPCCPFVGDATRTQRRRDQQLVSTWRPADFDLDCEVGLASACRAPARTPSRCRAALLSPAGAPPLSGACYNGVSPSVRPAKRPRHKDYDVQSRTFFVLYNRAFWYMLHPQGSFPPFLARGARPPAARRRSPDPLALLELCNCRWISAKMTQGNLLEMHATSPR